MQRIYPLEFLSNFFDRYRLNLSGKKVLQKVDRYLSMHDFKEILTLSAEDDSLELTLQKAKFNS